MVLYIDTEGQKIALFQYIAKNYKTLGITWSRVAEALSDIEYGDLAAAIREKHCPYVWVHSGIIYTSMHALDLGVLNSIAIIMVDPIIVHSTVEPR